MNEHEAINGYIQRGAKGELVGDMRIEGVDISPIVGVMFKDNGNSYLWLRRKDVMVYDTEEQKFFTRKREPRWEAYLEKQVNGSVVAYVGEFIFLRVRYTINGVWDKTLGLEASRLNLFVERMPMDKQDIILGIQKKKKKNG